MKGKLVVTLGVVVALVAPNGARAQSKAQEGAVRIESPSNGTVSDGTVQSVRVSYAFGSGPPVTRLELQVDGVRAATFDPPKPARSGTHTFEAVRMDGVDGDGTVTLVALARRANAGRTISKPVLVVADPQARALRRLQAASRVPPAVSLERGIPRFVDVRVRASDALGKDAVSRSLAFLRDYADLYRIHPAQLHHDRRRRRHARLLRPARPQRRARGRREDRRAPVGRRRARHRWGVADRAGDAPGDLARGRGAASP